MSFESLRSQVESFLSIKDKPFIFNHRYIADQVGMTKATFSRTMNGKRVPTFEEVRLICETIEKPNLALNIMEGYASQNNFKNMQYDVENNPYFRRELQQCMSNPRYFEILMMAFNGGLSISKFTKQYGDDGIKRVNELVEKGFVKLEGQNVIGAVVGKQIDISTVKELIKNSVEFHKAGEMGKKKNFIFFHAKPIDKTKRLRLYEFLSLAKVVVYEIIELGSISAETKEKMNNLMNFEHGDNKGETDVVFTSLVFDDFNQAEVILNDHLDVETYQ